MIIFCYCSYCELVSDENRQTVLDSIIDSGLDYEAVPDLCELATKRDPILKRWSECESLTVVACFPRSIQWLFYAAGAPLDLNKVKFHNLREDDPDAIVSSLLEKPGSPKEPLPQQDMPACGDWVPWFPVIDYDRCVNCKQCLNFCLFETYVLSDEETVQVQNPANCKTNCPACARVCPQKAIIFPKYTDAPINGEQVPEDDDSAPDIKTFADGDIHEILRNRGRNHKRFSSDAKAKPKQDLDIPEDVLKSLSADDIARIRLKLGDKDGK